MTEESAAHEALLRRGGYAARTARGVAALSSQNACQLLHGKDVASAAALWAATKSAALAPSDQND
jgi:hypothetical protein